MRCVAPAWLHMVHLSIHVQGRPAQSCPVALLCQTRNSRSRAVWDAFSAEVVRRLGGIPSSSLDLFGSQRQSSKSLHGILANIEDASKLSNARTRLISLWTVHGSAEASHTHLRRYCLGMRPLPNERFTWFEHKRAMKMFNRCTGTTENVAIAIRCSRSFSNRKSFPLHPGKGVLG